MMKESQVVQDAMLHFYDRLSASDVGSFDQLVSSNPATVVIGTAPGEIVRERNRLRFGFETEGLRIEPGTNPTGYEEGSLGWVIDEPTFVFPDGTPMTTRLTSVMHWEDGLWKLVHMHVSVGVPDEEVAELQRRWSS
jgi:SnoaL-like domain